MSAHDTATLERLVAELHDAAERLRAGELEPAQAAELVERCAQGAAQVSAELERLSRSAAQELGPAAPGRLV